MLASEIWDAKIKYMHEKLHVPKIPTCATIGAALLLGYAGYKVYDAWPRYGEITSVAGDENVVMSLEEPSIITANAHNELPEKVDELREEIELESPSIVAIQETNKKAVKAIGAKLVGWNIQFGQADNRRLSGGIGNLVMAKTPLENPQVHKIDSPGLVEDRIVTSATTNVTIEGRREEIQVMSYHISRHSPYRLQEFNKLLKIIADNRENASSTIVCGDSNSRPAQIQDMFGTIGFRAVTSPYKTYIGSPQGSIVDSCAYDQRGRVGFRRATIGKKFRTDHRPVRYELVKLKSVE